MTTSSDRGSAAQPLALAQHPQWAAVLHRLEVEIGVVVSAPVLGEGDGLPPHRGSGYEPAGVGDRLKGGGGTLHGSQEQEGFLHMGILIQVHDILLL